MTFQPGQSGNPAGKPKQKVIRDALMLALKDDADAPMRTKMDSIIRAHISKALEGDMPAIKEIYDRIDGKVAQAIVGDDEHDPIRVDGLQLLLQAIDGKTRSISNE